MIKNIKNNKFKSGFTLIEVIIACSIISICMFGLIEVTEKGLRLSRQAIEKVQAGFLLEEGVEAVKSIRDDNWSNISNLELETPYYLFFNNNIKKWEITDTVSNIDFKFNRIATFYSVERDSSDDIVLSGGTVDPQTIKVVISVDWGTYGGNISKNLSFYLTDIFN